MTRPTGTAALAATLPDEMGFAVPAIDPVPVEEGSRRCGTYHSSQ